VILGVKLRFGGRYDNIRMCVATPAGVKGGIAADISFFLEFGLSSDWSIHVDVPVFRPIVFAAAFKMLQFEPSVSFNYRYRTSGGTDLIVGPAVGLSLHYGPDYNSTRSGASTRPSSTRRRPTSSTVST